MPTPAELLAQSLAALRDANRIDGTRASYRKDSPGEFVSVMAYLDGGPRPNLQLSLMGQGLVLEEDARRALGIVEPPPTDFDVLNYRINTAGGGTNVTRAVWLNHTDQNMPTDQWGGVPVRCVKWSEAGYSYWGLYSFLIPTSYNSASEGNQYATLLDLHPVGGEVGWYGVGGISNMHIKYTRGNLVLQHYPNTDVGGRQEWDIAPGMAKGQRHTLLFHTIFGRPGLSVPNHPNGGMGKTRVAFDGSWVVDTGNIKNIYEAKVGLKETSRLIVLEGHYSYNQQTVFSYEMTAGLWGTTREEALSDSSVTYRGVAPTGGDSYTALPPLSSADFVLPTSLGG